MVCLLRAAPGVAEKVAVGGAACACAGGSSVSGRTCSDVGLCAAHMGCPDASAFRRGGLRSRSICRCDHQPVHSAKAPERTRPFWVVPRRAFDGAAAAAYDAVRAVRADADRRRAGRGALGRAVLRGGLVLRDRDAGDADKADAGQSAFRGAGGFSGIFHRRGLCLPADGTSCPFHGAERLLGNALARGKL